VKLPRTATGPVSRSFWERKGKGSRIIIWNVTRGKVRIFFCFVWCYSTLLLLPPRPPFFPPLPASHQTRGTGRSLSQDTSPWTAHSQKKYLHLSYINAKLSILYFGYFSDLSLSFTVSTYGQCARSFVSDTNYYAIYTRILDF
jgi:hypothetical protein